MRSRAFTLVELLVTISVATVLMAILMPVLAGARKCGKAIFCLSNLRQMAIAAANYTLSNDDYYPLAQYWQNRGSTDYEYCWDFTRVRNNGQSEIVPGLLWQGDTIEKVHQCPSYKGSDNWWGLPFTGYNYNTSYIGHGQGESVSSSYTGSVVPNPSFPSYKIVMSAKTTQVKRPGSCALFGDGHYAGGANKFMRSPWHWDGDYDFTIRKSGTQGYRHNGMTNVAWCDGHVTSQKELYTESIDKVRLQIERYNEVTRDCKIGFLSPDNSAYDTE